MCFIFADYQRRGQRLLESVLVGERDERAGCVYACAGCRDTAAQGGRASQSGHIVLQSSRKVCQSRREQLPHATRSKHW